MPLSYSTFQTLPLHIITIIVEYVLDAYPPGERNNAHAFSILHSCHRWRGALKDSKYVELRLNYNSPNSLESEITGLGFSNCSGLPALSIADKAKTMRFFPWFYYGFFDGRMLSTLLQSEYAGLVLPSVKKLEIIFLEPGGKSDVPCLYTPEDEYNAQQETMRFVQHLRAMLPNLTSISMDWEYDISAYTHDDPAPILNKMIRGLVDGIKNLAYLDSEDLLGDITFDPDAFSGLTSFHYYFKDADERGLEIILRNSSTLQDITAREMPSNFIDRMLYQENGNCIVYDCLKSIYLFYPEGNMSPNTEDYTCHFPSLKKLKVYGSDPVLTNALFNGSKHLEYLCLYTTYDSVDHINDRHMFRLCRLRNLKHLVLYYECRWAQVMLNDNPGKISQYSRFVEDMIKQPRCLQSISLTSSRYEARLVDILSTSTALSNIQKLKFTMKAMRFKDIVAVIGNCSQLKAIAFSAINDYPFIDGMKDEELVRHLETRMYPLSKYLASIYLFFDHLLEYHEIPLAMALLVVGCPRLSNIACAPPYRGSLQKGMQEQAEKSMFSNYCRRLENIVAKY